MFIIPTEYIITLRFEVPPGFWVCLALVGMLWAASLRKKQ